ncbi:MAG: hypothetical protein WAJ85_01010 [Candidatus Baltobacteraceae bacterium]|jgi:hypothetical protein
MRSTRLLRAALILWGVWELLNAILATFLPQWGASMVGWNPKFGWSSDIFAMSAQYGMGMFLLGFVYLLVASDPVRYRVFVWVAVAEQAIGIAIGFYGTFYLQTISLPQLCALTVINVVIGSVFLYLRPREAAKGAPEIAAALEST